MRGIVLLFIFFPPAFADVVPDYEALRAAAVQTGLSVQQCPELAESYGNWVARQRESESRREALLDSRQLGEKIHGRCREGIRTLELATGQDETALEALYRSETWYSVNRALASLRYWQAWLDLSLAQRAAGSDAGVTDLERARRGFEAASLRILFPGLVYGSWLGLAYVEQLQGDEVGMRKRLELLKRALASDPDNPLHEIIDTELGLVALRLDDPGPIRLVAGEPLSAGKARLVEEKAFLLLEQHRNEQEGAIEAAGYLQQLVEQGYLDDRLLTRILSYQDEIVGHEFGATSLLVDAEYAYAYQQYESNVLKFRQFLSSDASRLPLDLSLYYYHFAVSLYRIGLPRDSMQVIEKLRAGAQLPGELEASVAKLYFIVADAMYQSQATSANTRQLQQAAAGFVTGAPTDPDIASAHMALARLAGDDLERDRQLKLARKDSRLKESVRAVELEAALGRFQAALAAGDQPAVIAQAQSALEVIEGLPSDQRETLALQVVALQLRSVLADNAQDILPALETLYGNPALDSSQKRVLAWSTLRVIDRLQGAAALRDFVNSLPAAGTDSVMDQELYVLLREFDIAGRNPELAQLCELWLPRMQSQPQLQRQVWLLRINALRATARDEEALRAIQAMLAIFPNSGDAWEQLAVQSEAMGDLFAAERALAHIAAAEPEGSARWLATSVHRLRLLAGKADTGRACALYQRIVVYDHRLEESQQHSVAEFAAGNNCK
jgi:hypothetical protein